MAWSSVDLGPPELTPTAHEPVGGDDRRGRAAESGFRRERVDGELELRAARRGIALLADRERAPGLVVDDEERAVRLAVDAVGCAAEAQQPSVGERDLDRGPLGIGQAEAELGGEQGELVIGADLGVLGQKAIEVGQDPAVVAVPERVGVR